MSNISRADKVVKSKSSAEVAEDLVRLLDQLSLIEHAQDHSLIERLKKKYGWKGF